MTQRVARRELDIGVSGLLAGLTMAGVWALLAVTHPTATYHFAPGIVAAAWPLGARADTHRPLFLAIGGLAIGLAATVTLALGDALRGPTFFGESGAALEAGVMAAIGALVGGLLACRQSRGNENEWELRRPLHSSSASGRADGGAG